MRSLPGACVVGAGLRGRPGSALAPPLAAAFPSAAGRACDFSPLGGRAPLRAALRCSGGSRAPEETPLPRGPRVHALGSRRGKPGCPGAPFSARAGRRGLVGGCGRPPRFGRLSVPRDAGAPCLWEPPAREGPLSLEKAKSLADAKLNSSNPTWIGSASSPGGAWTAGDSVSRLLPGGGHGRPK